MAVAHTTLIMLLIMLNLLLIINSSSDHDKCREYPSCGPNQPPIRFPFQLVNESSQCVVHPAEFCLYCTQNNETMILLSTNSGPIKFLVTYIDYEDMNIVISDPENCLPKLFLERKLNRSSFLPYYRFDIELDYNTIVFFNCSSVKERHLRNQVQTSIVHPQDMITCPIYASNSNDSVLSLDLSSCTKMFEVNTNIDASRLSTNFLVLIWPKPNCAVGAAKGKKCRWNNNSTKGDIECYHTHHKRKTIHISKSIIFSTTGSIILGLVIIAITMIYLHFKEKNEDQARIDNVKKYFLVEDHS
ncbi:rust resistance kinase Lr10 [Trifolium repens]|nr:rust resistance kinase Lr10 [Trifolium repens]